MRSALLAILAAALLAGCGLPQPARTSISTWDFGPAPRVAQPEKLSGSILVLGADAPAWLDSPSLYYRLAYAQAAEPRAYASSRWISSPAALLTDRLRSAIAASGAAVLAPGDGLRASRMLRVEIEEFVQTFDSPDASHASARLRATAVSGGSLVGQRTFTVSVPAASPDARGAATALAEAADRAIAQIVGWLASLPR